MRVVDAEQHHIDQIVYGDVRQDDIDEWVLGSGLKYEHVLRDRLDLKTQYVRALLDEGGLCVCLWGVSPGADPVEGVVWLIATTEAEKVATRIHRFWPEEVGRMHMRHNLLTALAYGKNHLHLRWLKQIGFEHYADLALGPAAIPFTLFIRRAPSCVIQ
jgi:hypothetical protein